MAGTMPARKPAEPCTLVLFGAGGDLTRRLLMPSLYNLQAAGLLPEQFALLGVTHDAVGDEAFRKQMTNDLDQFSGEKIDPAEWQPLADRLHAIQGDFNDPGLYKKIADQLKQIGGAGETGGNVLFYLATPAQFFGPIVKRLGDSALVHEQPQGPWRRVIIEKPFGHDLASAEKLNADIGRVLKETQVYRVDHYLGKETVQNILVFRFANGLFEPIWNRNSIDHVEITVAETIGIEGRGGFYEKTGALRDMVQNHLLSLVSLLAMEPPVSLDADAIRDEKTKVLHEVKRYQPEDVLTQAVRGQYGPGERNGKPAPGYRQEPDVDPQSAVETFVAMRLELESWRWAGVPFYLRTGKQLAARATEVAVTFRNPPTRLFSAGDAASVPNRLVMRIQPDEGMSLQFGAKVPGPAVDVGQVELSFAYQDYFGAGARTGYEDLLYDAMAGDQTLFQRADTVNAGWSIVQPVLDVWQAMPARDFPNYAAGSWGPPEAEALMERDGRRWRTIPSPVSKGKQT